jgi:rhodanese-related sulfurtransferase
MANQNDSPKGAPGSPLLKDLPKEKLAEITEALQDKTVPAGTMIFRQGDAGDNFYIINSGKVRVFRKDRDGVETELSKLGRGQTFGEMALLTDKPRSANVETMAETHLTVLTKEDFHRVMSGYPEFSVAFVKQMSGWLMRDELRLEREAQRHYWLPTISIFDFILFIGLSIACGIGFNVANRSLTKPLFKFYKGDVPTIDVDSTAKKLEADEVILIDARPDHSYKKERIEGAVNMPLTFFDIMVMMELDEEDKEQEIIVYGRNISKHYDWEFAKKLIDNKGYKNTKILDGGLSKWKKKGYPVSHGESVDMD